MSFDQKIESMPSTYEVSIPLEQGNVFRLNGCGLFDFERVKFQSLWNRAMSFDYRRRDNITKRHRFNPFGTGQCLST